MIKKQQINIQLFLNNIKSSNVKHYSNFSDNKNKLSYIINSGKIKVRKFKIKKPISHWFFTSTFPNSGYFKRKVKATKTINLNFFYFTNFYLKKSSLNKNDFISLISSHQRSLSNFIPRRTFVFLVNNQHDYLTNSVKILQSNSDSLAKKFLLKKKTPLKMVCSNYWYFTKIYETEYKFFLVTDNAKLSEFITGEYLFLYNYSNLIMFNCLQ